MKKLFTSPKSVAFIALAAVLVVMTGLFSGAGVGDFWSLANIVKMLLAASLAYMLVFWNYSATEHYGLFRRGVQIFVFLAALGSLLVIMLSPSLANILVREDNYLENLEAVFLFAASAVSLLVALRFARLKDTRRAVVALFFFVLFFLIGMEEISWMQRIFHDQSGAFFQAHNQQDETNLHNMDTGLSEDAYYFGAFAFLVLVPFFRDKFAAFFKKKNWSFLTTFLPSAWFFIPFALMAGFVAPYSYQESTILLGFFGSVAILLYEIDRTAKLRAYAGLAVRMACLLLLIATGLWLTFHDAVLEAMRAGAPKEYMENLISFGMFVYAVDLYFRNFARGLKQGR